MRTKSYPNPRDPRRRNGTIRVIKADRGIYREAMALAGGDPRRIEIHPDGTCTVHNRPLR